MLASKSVGQFEESKSQVWRNQCILFCHELYSCWLKLFSSLPLLFTNNNEGVKSRWRGTRFGIESISETREKCCVCCCIKFSFSKRKELLSLCSYTYTQTHMKKRERDKQASAADTPAYQFWVERDNTEGKERKSLCVCFPQLGKE